MGDCRKGRAALGGGGEKRKQHVGASVALRGILIGRERLFALVSAVIRGLAKRKKPRRLRGHKDSLRQNGAASRAQSLILPPRGYVSRRKARMPRHCSLVTSATTSGRTASLWRWGRLAGDGAKKKTPFPRALRCARNTEANQMPRKCYWRIRTCGFRFSPPSAVPFGSPAPLPKKVRGGRLGDDVTSQTQATYLVYEYC